MKTQNQENSNQNTNKGFETTTGSENNPNKESKRIALISIPQCVASYSLNSLKENKIPCEYMGTDQSGRILMKIRFEQTQEKLVQELSDSMIESEQAIILIMGIVNAALQEALDNCRNNLKVRNTKYKKPILS